MKAEFGRVALGEKILDVEVRDVNLLSSILECVQAAVGILLEQMEPGEIVREPVGAQIPKDADAGLLFRE